MDRSTLLEALRSTVVEPPWIDAAWVGGSEATGRTDALSDIDLQLLVGPGRVHEGFERVEACLERLGGIAAVYDVPHLEGAPYRQRFYRPAGAPEHLMVDLCIFEPGGLAPFLDPDRHGQPVIWLDRSGALAPRRDETVPGRLQARRAALADRFALLAHIPRKELARGDVLAASDLYSRLLLGPLVEALRMRHCPERFDFGLRYLQRDLPPEVTARLEPLCLPGDAEGLGRCIDEARAWLDAELRAGEP